MISHFYNIKSLSVNLHLTLDVSIFIAERVQPSLQSAWMAQRPASFTGTPQGIEILLEIM